MSADGISFSRLHSGLSCMENKGVDTFAEGIFFSRACLLFLCAKWERMVNIALTKEEPTDNINGVY